MFSLSSNKKLYRKKNPSEIIFANVNRRIRCNNSTITIYLRLTPHVWFNQVCWFCTYSVYYKGLPIIFGCLVYVRYKFMHVPKPSVRSQYTINLLFMPTAVWSVARTLLQRLCLPPRTFYSQQSSRCRFFTQLIIIIRTLNPGIV